ncbi:MAG: sulfotransferase [Pseudomonadales bacterium]|nr:sulfotransferase [Halioglobus sp.]MCP5130079.1 sulfotransferase [Pseudomonadales bacterium]
MITIDFLVPGFSKCGTTTLCALLAQHPGIYIPELKEPWYFSAADFPRKQADYIQHFSPALPGQLLGEGSVSYSDSTMEDVSISRIRENNPECRFIFIARHPLRRIESSYREMHHSGVKFGLNAPFGMAQCLAAFPQMITDSLFYERISKYVDAFGNEAIQVIFLEDLMTQPQPELEKCFRHLGVDSGFKIEQTLQLNEGSSKLYDTRILRYLRTTPWTGFKLARLNPEQQDRLLRPLGLRRAFNKPVQWDEESLALVRERVQPDSRRFLEAAGKAHDFWRI